MKGAHRGNENDRPRQSEAEALHPGKRFYDLHNGDQEFRSYRRSGVAE